MKTRTRALTLAAAMLLICLLSGCGALKNAEALMEYDMDGDIIPSINAVVGQRTVTGTSTGVSNGSRTKEYSYDSDTVTQDLIEYLVLLMDEYGYLGITDFNVTEFPGSGQIAAESKDPGKIVIITFEYTATNYKIILTKGEGTLTLY